MEDGGDNESDEEWGNWSAGGKKEGEEPKRQEPAPFTRILQKGQSKGDGRRHRQQRGKGKGVPMVRKGKAKGPAKGPAKGVGFAEGNIFLKTPGQVVLPKARPAQPVPPPHHWNGRWQEPVTVPPPGPVRLIQPQSLLNARPFANGQPFNAFGPQVVPPRPALVEPPRGRGKIRPSQKRPDAPPPPPPPAKPKWKEELSQQLRDIGNGVLLRYEKALLEYGSLGVLVDMLQKEEEFKSSIGCHVQGHFLMLKNTLVQFRNKGLPPPEPCPKPMPKPFAKPVAKFTMPTPKQRPPEPASPPPEEWQELAEETAELGGYEGEESEVEDEDWQDPEEPEWMPRNQLNHLWEDVLDKEVEQEFAKEAHGEEAEEFEEVMVEEEVEETLEEALEEAEEEAQEELEDEDKAPKAPQPVAPRNPLQPRLRPAAPLEKRAQLNLGLPLPRPRPRAAPYPDPFTAQQASAALAGAIRR